MVDLDAFPDIAIGDVRVTFRALGEMDPRDAVRMFSMRREVFVDRLGWRDLPTAGAAIEVDQFDNEHARYILAHDAAGNLRVTCRMLPGEVSMVPAVWPGLLDLPGAPALDQSFEVSRICSDGVGVDFTREAIRLFRMAAIHAGALTRFGVANGQILRVYRRLLIRPDHVAAAADAPEFHLCVWRERGGVPLT